MSTPQEQAQAALREAVAVGEELQGQLATIEDQLGYLAALTKEFQRSRTTLEALKALKKGEEVLMPIGGGNFVRAHLAEADQVISGIGAGVSVEGGIEDALRRVDEQLAAAKEASQRLQDEGQRVMQQMQAVEERLQQMAG